MERTMSVWLCIPSARPVSEVNPVMESWRRMGYKVALWCDLGKEIPARDLIISDWYPGYAKAVNQLALAVLRRDPECDWIVTGGDDTYPDPSKQAGEIEFQCGRYFGEQHGTFRMEPTFSDWGHQHGRFHWSTFGVMQPTGDRFAGGSIDRIAGSPWIGREFCERMYGGNGPYWPEYKHMFVDEEIMQVALKMGCFWQRPDLTHLHRHFMRQSDAIHSPAVPAPIPPHLVEANSPAHWDKYQALFNQRKAAGFPGHAPLPQSVTA